MQKLICLAVCLLAALYLVTPQLAPAESLASVTALRIVNSGRAVGLGGAVVNLVDEESPLYNPGAAGLFHLNKYLAITSRGNTRWLPELSNSRLHFKTFCVSGGYAMSFGDESDTDRPRVALAGAYSRQKLDFGSFPFEGGDSNSPHDKADGFTIAAGLDYYLRFGVGYTHKKIKSDLSVPYYSSVAKGDASDYGFLLEIPVGRLLNSSVRKSPTSNGELQLEFTPSFALVKSNVGDDIKYPEAINTDPLPTAKKAGLAIKAGINRDNLPLATLLLVHESEITIPDDDNKSTRQGVELGLYDVFFARLGKLDDGYGELHPYTFGFGLSVGGLLTWLESRDVLHRGDILRRVDLNFDYAQYEGGDYPLADTKFYRLRLSI